jgi:hypothetical protein
MLPRATLKIHVVSMDNMKIPIRAVMPKIIMPTHQVHIVLGTTHSTTTILHVECDHLRNHVILLVACTMDIVYGLNVVRIQTHPIIVDLLKEIDSITNNGAETLATLNPKFLPKSRHSPKSKQPVGYNPGDIQGDHSNGTWNDEQQQNVSGSCGASMLREAPVQAMITNDHQAPTQTLTYISCITTHTDHVLINGMVFLHIMHLPFILFLIPKSLCSTTAQMLLTPPSPSTYIPPPHTRWHPGHVLSV